MTILSSVLQTGHAQRDGRRYAREIHTDHLGAQHIAEYLWDGLSDQNATMAARALRIAEALAAAEYAGRVAVDRWPGPLDHQTGAEFADKLRAEYRTSSRERVCYLAWWLLRRINEGTFTDAQVRNAFGMTVVQYNTFKTNKLIPMHDHWAAVIVAQGE